MSTRNGVAAAPSRIPPISSRAEPPPRELHDARPRLGFWARSPKHEAPPGYLTGDSRDWNYSPRRGKWKRRAGSLIKGDTLAAGIEQTGTLTAKWSAKARQAFELASDSGGMGASLTDGNPTLAAIWTNESGIWGQLAFYNTNGTPAWKRLGDRFATDYPVAGASTPNRFRMPPIYSDNALQVSRCVNEKQRRMLFCGMRQGLAQGNWFYAPNDQGTPIRVNLQWSDASQQAYNEKVWPSGHIPPLRVPSVATPAATNKTTDTWLGKNRFILTCAYRYEDGSIGRPFVPVGPGFVPTNGATPDQNFAGWVNSLDGVTPTNTFTYIDYNNIPNGGPGTVSTILMRSPVTDQSGIPAILDSTGLMQLGIIAEIANNTTQTYRDYNGNDASLFVDAVNIRFADHKAPPRGRYIFTFDGHVATCGKLKANPAALYVGPWSIGASFYTQNDDNMDLSVVNHVAVRDDQIQNPRNTRTLMCGQGATYPTTGITCGSGNTVNGVLQDLLKSKLGDGAKTVSGWGAQGVPGVDGNALASNLAITQVYANFTTVNNNPTITVANGGDGGAGSVANVVVGMLIKGAGIPVGTYVGSVGATTVGLVDINGAAVNATASATVALKIGWDYGDVNPGEARAFSLAYCVPLYFTKAYLDTLPTDERAVDFTGADPGHPKYAANSYYVRNRRTVPSRAGRCMGGVEVQNGSVVFYTRGKATMTNTRGGKTNIDDDWLLQFVNGSRGTISDEIIQGNNWGARLTPQGIEVCDATGSRIISEAIYDPSEKYGELAYEIAQCRIAALAGSDGGQFHAMLSDGRLYVSYRSSAAAAYPDRYMVYDFSPSAGQDGISEVVRDDGSPYGWSCPHRLPGGEMAEVQDAGGTHLYALRDSNAGASDGRVDEFETGTTDNGSVIAPIGYHSMLVGELMEEFTVRRVRSRYKKNGTGFQIGLSSDKNRSRTPDYLSLASSGTNEFTLDRSPPKSGMASPREVIEVVYADDGSGNQPEFEGALFEYVRQPQSLAQRS